MDKKTTILVNGTLYDAVTGMPVGKQPNSRATTAPDKRQARPSHQVHKRTDTSHATNRRQPNTPLIQKRSEARRTVPPAVMKSTAVTRFAPHTPVSSKQPQLVDDIRPAQTHPIAQKAEQRMQQTRQHHGAAPVKPSAILKKEAIDKALREAPSGHGTKRVKRTKRTSKIMSFASVALSLLLLTGYLTYINLPNLSVRVAANQAGIDASYPGYRPDGYRLAGVNYDTGSVSLEFAANAGPQNFTITQQQTSWDSTAVRENYVKSQWGDDVIPYSERGLTIYAHDGEAAWVNGGILYTITGDATLSTSQVRSIATSL